MDVTASDSDTKCGEESIPEFVVYGRMYIDGDNVRHVGMHISKEYASLWFQNHVRVASWVWSTEVELKVITGKEYR